MPFYPFLGEGAPTKIDYRKKLVPWTLILTSLLEDLAIVHLAATVYMAMGHDLCLHNSDEHPRTTYFDVDQGFPGF